MGRVVLGLNKINVYGFLNVLDYKYQVSPVSITPVPPSVMLKMQ